LNIDKTMHGQGSQFVFFSSTKFMMEYKQIKEIAVCLYIHCNQNFESTKTILRESSAKNLKR